MQFRKFTRCIRCPYLDQSQDSQRGSREGRTDRQPSRKLPPMCGITLNGGLVSRDLRRVYRNLGVGPAARLIAHFGRLSEGLCV